MIDLKNLTITKARKHLDNGDFSALDLARAYLDEIKKKDGEIHAYLEVFSDVARQAEEADKKISAQNKSASGEKASTDCPLLGIPFAIKDNMLIKGRRAGSASKILEGYVAPYDATVIEKLKKAGAIFLGRTNMDEFAMGSSTETSAYGPSKNPIDLSRVPGGSSGGSAAAVAGDLALVALGSDTGGSIRQPASFCGLVGLKPTYGAVSRYGLMAMGSSLDIIGPITKTVADAEAVFSVIKGQDPRDSTSVDLNFKKAKNRKIKVADLTEYIEEMGKGGVDEVVMNNYKESIKKLSALGYEIVKPKTDLSSFHYALATYYVIMPAEVSTNLARFDGVRFGFHKEAGKNLLADYKETRGEGFGREARRRILLGAYVLSSGYYDAFYGKATKVRGLIKKTFEKVFEEVDLVSMPTTPTPAFKFGEKTKDPVSMYLADILTVTANMAGVPAISIPSGFAKIKDSSAKEGLPLGLQLVAPLMAEETLFEVGKNFLGEK